ncbi:PREDICTED: uncharacterized protein LOC102022115 isoform X3 [Chinchilla lanigera]|uniref:uncharacterized protein LOC102022115 isoform X3 n=1 Tax=Chinchilla lanigera TaxID=34839 RepID=UPI000695EED1|nr:PREDICTED: uncharacterized protein LOC102022115 isoform X3 [Chinchilla lanigera]
MIRSVCAWTQTPGPSRPAPETRVRPSSHQVWPRSCLVCTARVVPHPAGRHRIAVDTCEQASRSSGAARNLGKNNRFPCPCPLRGGGGDSPRRQGRARRSIRQGPGCHGDADSAAQAALTWTTPHGVLYLPAPASLLCSSARPHCQGAGAHWHSSGQSKWSLRQGKDCVEAHASAAYRTEAAARLRQVRPRPPGK